MNTFMLTSFSISNYMWSTHCNKKTIPYIIILNTIITIVLHFNIRYNVFTSDIIE